MTGCGPKCAMRGKKHEHKIPPSSIEKATRVLRPDSPADVRTLHDLVARMRRETEDAQETIKKIRDEMKPVGRTPWSAGLALKDAAMRESFDERAARLSGTPYAPREGPARREATTGEDFSRILARLRKEWKIDV